MRTAVISDLHLGAGNDADMLRRRPVRERLLAELEPAERIVLLGDVVELRDRPIADAFALAEPFFAELGDLAAAGKELVVVPGNHDHHAVEPWLERRQLEGEPPLGLEQRIGPAGTPLESLARLAPFELAYPGAWLRDDVYATHGHYLDRHLTIPTFERLGIAAIERLLGFRPSGPDPLEPPGAEEALDPISYEHAQSPVYALLFALAQGQSPARGGPGNPTMRIWRALGGGETRASRLRGWLLGSVAVPGAVGLANRLGLGPVDSDLSPQAITRAGVAAIGAVVSRLAIEAEHVIFGHTHRRGPLPDDGGWAAPSGARLWNTGSWVHSPTLLGPSAARSPYWPGTVAWIAAEGEPELRHLLDDLGRQRLREAARPGGPALAPLPPA